MVRGKYCIILIFLELNCKLVMGTGLFSALSELASFFNVGHNDDQKGHARISFPYIDFIKPTSLCDSPPPYCPATRYRSLNGSCNNLANPGWGTPNTTYGRLLPSRYDDGISSFAKAESGRDLPNARKTSFTLFHDSHSTAMNITMLAMQYGQLISHDMALTKGVSQLGTLNIACCVNGTLAPNALANSRCAPISVPKDDPAHKRWLCLDFIRTQTSRDIGCVFSNEPAEQMTEVTAFMDGSELYGSSDAEGAALRDYKKGRLKTDFRNGYEWPPRSPNITQACPPARLPEEPCYLGGDSRINQNLGRSFLQTTLIRYHNLCARDMHQVNPHWNDERIFQECRRIVIAILQNINYYEYFPKMLGKQFMLDNKLIYERNESNLEEYIDDYDPTVNPSVINEFATAAFRFFLTIVRNFYELVNENIQVWRHVDVSQWYNRPKLLEKPGIYAKLTRGLSMEKAADFDPYFSVVLTKYLFRNIYKREHGSDLLAITIQRGRDHGLGSYVSARAACGLSIPKTFDDMLEYCCNKSVQEIKQVYEDVKDIDLMAGGTAESPIADSILGPTFQCIMLQQLYRTRKGDRFFFENGSDKLLRFKPTQLKSIRSVTMSSLMCDTSDVTDLPPEAFARFTVTDDLQLYNFFGPCENIPKINITLWKE